MTVATKNRSREQKDRAEAKPANNYIILRSKPILEEVIEFLRGPNLPKLNRSYVITEALMYRAESKGFPVAERMQQLEQQ